MTHDSPGSPEIGFAMPQADSSVGSSAVEVAYSEAAEPAELDTTPLSEERDIAVPAETLGAADGIEPDEAEPDQGEAPALPVADYRHRQLGTVATYQANPVPASGPATASEISSKDQEPADDAEPVLARPSLASASAPADSQEAAPDPDPSQGDGGASSPPPPPRRPGSGESGDSEDGGDETDDNVASNQEADKSDTTHEDIDKVPVDELGVDPREAIWDRCLEEVEYGLEDVRGAIAAGTFDQSGYDGEIVGFIVEDTLADALRAGDQEQAEADLDFLLQIPNIYEDLLTEACYNVAITGNQHAFDILRGRLEAGKKQAIAGQAALRDAMPSMRRLVYAFTSLDEVVKACESHDTPPDTWIDLYAVDAEHRWQLYTAHYRRLAESSKPEAAVAQARFEQKAQEFVTDDSLDPAFVFSDTEYLLSVVKNPELQAKILARFYQVTGKMMLTQTTFMQFLGVGNAVLENTALATQENIEIFENTIALAADMLHEAGIDPYEITHLQLSWRMALKQYYGSSPQELVDYLDLQTSQMLAADIPPDVDPEARAKSIVDLRDYTLSTDASASAVKGDFVSARLFLQNISGDHMQVSTLISCLLHAKSQDQVDAIKPDEMTLQFNPRLGMQFRIKEAVLENDPKKLSSLALEIAGITDEPFRFNALINLQRIYNLAAQHEGGPELAGKLLGVLRGWGAKYSYTQFYSEVLIRAGDNDELAKAYDDIDRNSLNASYRLLNLWRLAQLLDT
jgi:hypothetical protein